MKIGIGITTQNRYETFKKTLDAIKKYSPNNAKIVVVDDASTERVKEATYRFDRIAGISVAKNKCLELLDDCEHIFLFDDDCRPTTKDWWKPYVESREPHLCYIFKDFVNRELNDCKELYKDNEIVAYSHARGCMLYLDHKCLDVVGGFDTRHRRWGNEHIHLSDRIFNTGLTTFRYMDVIDSGKLFYSEDEHEAIEGTVPIADRRRYLAEISDLRAESKSATHFCEYKQRKKTKRMRSGIDVVIAPYLVGQLDVQRNEYWSADYKNVEKLAKSVGQFGHKLVLINDCFDSVPDNNVELYRVETKISPYWQRWVSKYQYLREHEEINNVFLVDATDVEMLNNPFDFIEDDKLYVGDENETLMNGWLLRMHKATILNRYFRMNREKQLLNCGVIGGNRELVMQFIHDIYGMYFDNKQVGETEMGAFNYVAYTKYADRIIHGRMVTTEFKKYEEKSNAWFRHK